MSEDGKRICLIMIRGLKMLVALFEAALKERKD
jgi:hypothetical protein